jgi:dienelactone hydrolase
MSILAPASATAFITAAREAVVPAGAAGGGASPWSVRAFDRNQVVSTPRITVAHSWPDGAAIAMTIYPGVHHAFVPQLKAGTCSLGHWLEYDEAAAKEAERQLRGFLAANLGGAPSGTE